MGAQLHDLWQIVYAACELVGRHLSFAGHDVHLVLSISWTSVHKPYSR